MGDNIYDGDKIGADKMDGDKVGRDKNVTVNYPATPKEPTTPHKRASTKLAKRFPKLVEEIRCGHCGAQKGYEIEYTGYQWSGEEWAIEVISGNAFVVIKCHVCELLTIFTFDIKGMEIVTSNKDRESAGYFCWSQRPEIIKINDFDGILEVVELEFLGQYPDNIYLDGIELFDISNDFNEARHCLAVGAASAAVIMCRRVVERIANHFNIGSKKGDSLATILRKLRESGQIAAELHDGLDIVRIWGNLGAHPNNEERNINIQEAREIVDFVHQIIQFSFPTEKSLVEKGNELKQLKEERKKSHLPPFDG